MNGAEPSQLPDPEAYRALTQGVGIVRWDERTVLRVCGQDRAKLLHNLCTNDIVGAPAGAGREAFLCTVQGKILAHVHIYVEADAHVIETVPGQAAKLAHHLDRYVIREDVAWTDQSSAVGQVLIAGSGAVEWCRARFGEWGGESFPDALLQHAPCPGLGDGAVLRRVPFLGDTTFALQVAREELESVWTKLQARGAHPCPGDVAESVRLEQGYPWYGSDIGEHNLPQEIQRDAAAIHFQKGCYLGQETVARIDALGHVNRLLVGVLWEGTTIPAPGSELLRSGAMVGQVTSAGWSPRRRSPLALALVRRPAADPGTMLESPTGTAQVVSLPLA